MSYFNDYSGCKVLIYTEKNEKKIGETVVKRHDKERNIIELENELPLLKEHEKVSLIILEKYTVLECKGTVRKRGGQDHRDIALYQEQIKDKREETRYPTSLKGKAENLIIGGKRVPLSETLDILILDISKDGILIRTKINTFNVGTAFQIKMDINGKETVLNAQVKRIDLVDGSMAQFGCKLTGRR